MKKYNVLKAINRISDNVEILNILMIDNTGAAPGDISFAVELLTPDGNEISIDLIKIVDFE